MLVLHLLVAAEIVRRHGLRAGHDVPGGAAVADIGRSRRNIRATLLWLL